MELDVTTAKFLVKHHLDEELAKCDTKHPEPAVRSRELERGIALSGFSRKLIKAFDDAVIE